MNVAYCNGSGREHKHFVAPETGRDEDNRRCKKHNDQ